MNARNAIDELALVMTQTEMAEALEVSQPTISRWLNGHRERIDFDTVEALINLRAKYARAIAKAKAK